MSTNNATTHLTLEAAHQHLRRLGFYGLLARAESLLHEPWLARVIAIEDAERQHRSLKRRLDHARLGAFKPLADFDWSWPTKCDRALVEELFSLAFIGEGIGTRSINRLLGEAMGKNPDSGRAMA